MPPPYPGRSIDCYADTKLMGIKRDPSLIPLSHDHHRGLMRVFEIRMALRHDEPLVDQQRINASFLREELLPHFAAEEQHLFPVLRNLIDTSEVDALIAEHRDIERLARSADTNDVKPFADLLERHIRKEEREIFQEYQARVAADDLAAVGAAIKKSLNR